MADQGNPYDPMDDDDEYDADYYDELLEAYAGAGDSTPPATVPRDTRSYYDANSNTEFTYRQQQGVDDGEYEYDASMFGAPADLLVVGSFNDAKEWGINMDRWLVVNVQSAGDESSQLLNRDVWTDGVLADLIKDKFLLWQEYREWEEGQKVCAYYNLDSFPAILVVDPITGKMMHAWAGVVTPEELCSYLLPLCSDQSPRDHCHLLATTRRGPEAEETTTTTTTTTSSDQGSTEGQDDAAATVGELCERFEGLVLGEEPARAGDDVCRVAVRLPDGRRLQRRFQQGESIRMLWAFCLQHLEEEGAVDGAARRFHFIIALPGNSKRLAYDDDLSFREAAVSNTLITLVWD